MNNLYIILLFFACGATGALAGMVGSYLFMGGRYWAEIMFLTGNFGCAVAWYVCGIREIRRLPPL